MARKAASAGHRGRGVVTDAARQMLSVAPRAAAWRSSIDGREGKRYDLMKAVVQDRFGPPDVLQLTDTDTPEVGASDVLIRMQAAALNPADGHILRGHPLVARLMGVGLTRPKARVAGIDAAGVVAAVGANVRGLRAGDAVLGFCQGALAEYACASADVVVPKPASLTFEQAAAVPVAATTGLRGSRAGGEGEAGQPVPRKRR